MQPSEVNRAPAVDRQDLPGDEGRAGEEVYRLRNVFGCTHAPQGCRANDTPALRVWKLTVLGPGDCAWRNPVHAYSRRELHCQCARERGEARLGNAVERVTLERPLGVDVDDIDDGALLLGEVRR